MIEGVGHPANRPQDLVLASALAAGATQHDAARRAGLSVRTARRRLEDPAFGAMLERLRGAAMETAVDELAMASVRAVQTLVELTGAEYPPSVRHGAAKTILTQATRLHEVVESEHRLRTLESGAFDADWDS